MRRLPLGLALLLFGCGDDPPSDGPADAVADTPDVADTDTVADTPGELPTEDVLPDGTDAELDVEPPGLPTHVPFEIVREPAGDAPSEADIDEFTDALTGLWADSRYFRWVRMTSHGVDRSNEEGWFHYALWWQDTISTRDGDTVRWQHVGRADNLTLRTCKVLTNAIAGYMMTGDEDMRWVVEEYSRGLAALAMVMEFGEDDPAPYLQARAPFTRNHSFETVGGRRVEIDYDPVRRQENAWNARIVHNPTNPHWGDVHFVNQRSKDDVPHMLRAMPMLMRASQDAPDESVREAADLALEYLRGFSADVIASGYQIRTKYEDGVPVVPLNDAGAVKDLASLVLWDAFIPDAECAAKYAIDLAATGESDFECGQGIVPTFESAATTTHYFNYAIIRMFHVAAAHLALMERDNDAAEELLLGLAVRAERMLDDPEMPNRDVPEFDADVAVYLVSAAAAGLPLTGREARFVQEHYHAAAEHYGAFAYWDPWADSVDDGEFGYVPSRGTTVRPTEIAYVLEYCYSPFRSEFGAQFVDCDRVAQQ